jgi:hypothetical protein
MLFTEKIAIAGLPRLAQDARQNATGGTAGKGYAKSENHFHLCSSISGIQRYAFRVLRSLLVHACRTFAFAVAGR